MGRWIKKHKGLFIFLCIFITFVVMIAGVVACSVNMSKKMLETLMTNETAVVERRDLVEAISASGTIVSSDSVLVTARVSNVDVEEVFVELGDWVEAGTLICTLDTTKLEETLAIAEANLSATEQQLNMSVAAAQRQYNDAVNAQNQTNTSAQTSVTEAERTLSFAQASYNAASANYNNTCNEINPSLTALGDVIKYDGEIETLENEIATLDGKKTAAETELAGLTVVSEGEEGYDEYISKKTELETSISNYVTDINNKNNSKLEKSSLRDAAKNKVTYSIMGAYYNLDNKTEATNMKNELEASKSSAYASYLSAQNNLNSAQDAYNRAVENASTPSSSSASTVASARDNLTNAQTNAQVGTLSAQQQIEGYQDQIDHCTVYAPISGMVTSVSVKAGDLYAGSAIITIENTSVYDVETYISEYDISKIKVGQEVIIKTNGTGDLELEGIVKTIAPRATVSASGVAYKVVVQVNTACEDLRLDMTAKLSIILNKAENVVTVPYESVQYDDDGNTYVEISKGKNPQTGLEEKEKVYVTTGVESAYYIEITSGALTEGSKVIVPRSEYNALDIYALLEEEGALGGY